ncbi:hypothetical protein JTB14_015708 [Gonioctena quinquepunctata]|nr:hypothetical protein JTB14_015708 [Gonioctena quinquepunctata]
MKFTTSVFLAFVCFSSIHTFKNGYEIKIISLKTGNAYKGNPDIVSIEQEYDSNDQIWVIEEHSSGNFIIHSKSHQGKVLDVCPVTRQLLVWPKHGERNQQLLLNPDGTISSPCCPGEVLKVNGNHVKMVPNPNSKSEDSFFNFKIIKT